MTPNETPPRLLLIEDNSQDAELVEHELHAGGLRYEMKRVDTREDYEQALQDFRPDLVLCDYTLPRFDGKAALLMRNQLAPTIPFVYVSGSLGEENAIEALKLGATDYVLKDRLRRLTFSVRRALNEGRQRRERGRMEEELRQAEKLASVGLLLGGVAHELNNPLMAILGHAQLLLSDARDGTQLRDDLGVIEREAKRCKRLIKSLLAFGRRQEKQFLWADILPMVEEILELKSYDLKRASIELAVDIPDEIGKVYVDPNQVQQVLLNLLNNAEQAIGTRKGRIKVSASRDDGGVTIEVADDGPGIPRDIVERIFEPFFTTKDPGKGTGLGLSICADIAKEHGGTLSVHSAPGAGARFSLHLPAREDQPQVSRAPQPAAKTKRGRRTLVVDDDDMVLKFIARALRHEGWEVETHSIAAEGLEAARQRDFDLVICDYHMPAMHGGEFYRRAVADKPALAGRFILCTGSPNVDRARPFADGAGVPILVKPFDLEEFKRALGGLQCGGGGA